MPIENVKSLNCTGCSACANICPNKAIFMCENKDGFLYPLIDKEKCTNCGLCDKICPVINPQFKNVCYPKSYAVMSSDDIRLNGCSSGGTFPLLAKYYLSKGWYVSGAKFLQDGSLQHIVTNDIDELKFLIGSKYLQSSVSDVYVQIRQLLDNSEKVLFSGTPCQVAGLKAFLQKDYTNLFTIDIVCHGVPSPKVFKKYLNEEMLDTQDEKWINTNFRDKVKGWNSNLIATTTTSAKQISKNASEDSFMKAFLGNYCLRESCSVCKFAKMPRQGDITIGDFWGIDDYNKIFNDQKGTSLLLINSKKGNNIINEIKSDLKLFVEVPISVALKGNWNLDNSSIPSDNRKLFFELLDKRNLKEILEICSEDKCDYLLVNFWWSLNYGAAITAWAMQELLKSFDLVPKLLNIKDDWVNSLYNGSFTERFAKDFLDLTKEMSLQDAQNLSKNCKGAIAGSDQVFRLEYINELNFKRFFLDFLNIFNRKIALAASFGINKEEFNNYKDLTEEKLYRMTSALNSFDYLSCREISGREIYKDVFGLNSDMILDPVFLINKDRYNDIIKTSNKSYKGKIVSYILDYNENFDRIYGYIKQQLNKSIIKIKDGYKDKSAIEVADFIKAFCDAEFIITDSYHGACLSLIFNKPFICLKNKDRGSARFDSLIEIFNIKDNFVTSINDILSKNLNLNMDYNSINKILEDEKSRCLTRIKEVLIDNYSNNNNAKMGKVVNYIISNFANGTLENTKNNEIYTSFIDYITKMNIKIDEVFLYLNSNMIYREYYKYNFLSKLLLGKKRKYYKQKLDILREKIRIVEIINKLNPKSKK